MKQKNQTVQIAYMALYAALYVVLKKFVGDMIPFLQMPQGGSIEIELLVLFVASYHLGWKKGILTGILCWLITFVMGSGRWFVSVPQYSLDYFLPLFAVGSASVMWKKDSKGYDYMTVIIAMAIKWLCNVLSGTFFWFPEGSAAGSGAAWVNSIAYNTPYNVATLIVCVLLVPPLVKRLKKTNIEFED